MLEVRQLNFHYKAEAPILSDLQFELQDGEILAVLGESGSGKSTLLNLIYGLQDAESGEIIYNSEKVTGPRYNLVPGNLKMKFVPQEFDLVNSITVAENVGKYLSNFDLPLKAENIKKALKVVEMQDFSNHFPSQLSGGQRQRIVIARAIATAPKMLLLDEPYSHLDHPLKYKIRKSIWSWAKKTNCSVVLTTHDVNDALGFSDKILILKEGKMVQFGSPESLRNQPLNEYVASMFGEFTILNSNQMKAFFDLEIPDDKNAIIYPEEFSINGENRDFQLRDIRFKGRDYILEVFRDGVELKVYNSEKIKEEFISLQIKNYRLIGK